MPGLPISLLPPKPQIDPTDYFVVAIPPYNVLGSNRRLTGAQLLSLQPTYFESCIIGNVNFLAGTSVVPGQNLILTEGEYVLNWSSSVTDGVISGINNILIGFNTNSLLVNYDVSDQVVMCSTRFFSFSSAQERIPFHTCGRIIIPAGQTWIIKPTVNNNNSPLMTIGADNILTALKIA